jgi:hypothetical protein
MPTMLDGTERMVATRDSTVTFLSRRSELKLVRKPERDQHDMEGNVFNKIPGERLAFRDGQLRVPVGKGVGMAGENGEALDATEILHWLERHRMNGDREEGFWKLEEPAPTPTEDEQNTLANLAMDLDIPGLEWFIAQEQDGWKRSTLLGTARQALERAKEKIAEIEAKAEAKAATQAPSKGNPSAPQGKHTGSTK